MPNRHKFVCSRCGNELLGPEATGPVNQQQIGKRFTYGTPVRCTTSSCPIIKPALIYQGIVNGPPVPPAPPGAAAAHGLPSNWVAVGGDDESGYQYTTQLRYPFIPPLHQRTLIDQLRALFAEQPVPLLAAVLDRFHTEYVDRLNDPIKAEETNKHLSIPLVLTRLNRVMEQLAADPITWADRKIDRNLGADVEATLRLPVTVTHAGHDFDWHLEALNDLVNPREGHAVEAGDYASALRAAMAMKVANHAGETQQGPNIGYYLWSTSQNRGIVVVFNVGQHTRILTVYYANAATRWFAHEGAGELDYRSI